MNFNDTHEMRELNGDELALVAGGFRDYFSIAANGPCGGAVRFPGGSYGFILGTDGQPLNPFFSINAQPVY
jgi:hypothetical protein